VFECDKGLATVRAFLFKTDELGVGLPRVARPFRRLRTKVKEMITAFPLCKNRGWLGGSLLFARFG
jgi:hypothetical protein